jgi:hypothetical protein
MVEQRLAPRMSINWRAAVYAGIAAGIVATVAQMLLWWSFWDVLPGILYRDARLAAAMVMGRGVLPPPASFDWTVMAVATLIHFALSVVYSAVLASFIARCSLWCAVLVGIVYGLALFAINMYGFTLLFPWFSEARDWITMLTHAVFGASAAWCYRALAGR